MAVDWLQKLQKSTKHEQSKLSNMKISHSSVVSPVGKSKCSNVKNVKKFSTV